MSFRRLLIITVLIVLPIESYALSPLYSFRHLYEQTRVSPLPSSSYVVNLASGGSNNGESHQHVKMTILPAKNTIKKINITSHQIKKAKISLGIDFSSTIALTPSDGNRLISTAAAPSPENHQQKYASSGTYITPTNGAYLAILLLIIGGSLTFFKLRTRGRHLEGVPYHELEMGNSTALNMEENETENWGQDWNDEWGDEKPVKSGGDNHVLVKQANNIITKLPNSNGRKKERND